MHTFHIISPSVTQSPSPFFQLRMHLFTLSYVYTYNFTISTESICLSTLTFMHRPCHTINYQHHPFRRCCLCSLISTICTTTSHNYPLSIQTLYAHLSRHRASNTIPFASTAPPCSLFASTAPLVPLSIPTPSHFPSLTTLPCSISVPTYSSTFIWNPPFYLLYTTLLPSWSTHSYFPLPIYPFRHLHWILSPSSFPIHFTRHRIH